MPDHYRPPFPEVPRGFASLSAGLHRWVDLYQDPVSAVEILQRLHRYEEAVRELEDLLSQKVYCPDSRGRWWDGLALNLHQHLKRLEPAMECITEGLADPRWGRASPVAVSDSRAPEGVPKLSEVQAPPPAAARSHRAGCEAPDHHGRLCPQLGMGKCMVVMQAGGAPAPATVLCSVQELVLDHYRYSGLDQGVHGEGSAFRAPFGLLLWDVIFLRGHQTSSEMPSRHSRWTCAQTASSPAGGPATEARLRLILAAPPTSASLGGGLAAGPGKQSSILCQLGALASLKQAKDLVFCLGKPQPRRGVPAHGCDYRSSWWKSKAPATAFPISW
ncbi:hypothetical protein QTO34_008259 [Cnephaeus nilssonii]|uniref:Fanconi-associated nuclease n=1 Tax=Cnephaeus nilssonii TaxID=3371016 RepID=A0AA40LW61_CNENI|nr:hypothetical protein QTO34_008259 [Eptesicus nilssonii]